MVSGDVLLSQSKNGISALALKRHLGVSYPTAWLMRHKLMQVMYEREQATILSGRIEIDDAFPAVSDRVARTRRQQGALSRRRRDRSARPAPRGAL